MKNSISYFYNMLPNKIEEYDGNYYFRYKNINYVLVNYYYDSNKIESLFNYVIKLNQNGFYCHQIIKNREQKIISFINNKEYILLSYYKDEMNKINIDNIINFNYPALFEKALDCTNWKLLWSQKLDYFEYQLNQIGIKHSILKESYPYFSGYVELAISLLNEVDIKNALPVLAHNRITKNDNIYALYDPLNFVIDYKVRDICEYIKSILLDNNVFLIIQNYVISKYTKDEISLFLIRLLYPSIYFDIFEQIINGENYEDDLKKIINNVDNYELTIKKIFKLLLPYSSLPMVEL